MNRREVLLLLGLTACGSHPKPRRPRKRQRATYDVGPPPPHGDDWSNKNTTQYGTSPLAVRDDLIARVTTDELLFIDATSLLTTDLVQVPFRSVCVTPNGAILGFTDSNRGPCELDVFDPAPHLAHAWPTDGCVPGDGYHLVAAGVSDVYTSRGNRYVAHYRLENDGLTKLKELRLSDLAVAGRTQAVGLPDGRVLIPASDSIQIYGESTPHSIAVKGSIAHLCRGAGDRIWYSTFHDHVVDRVVLARLGPTIGTNAPTIEAELSFAPARVTHMASGEDGSLVVMTFLLTKTEWHWVLVLVDPSGREQRRIEVEDDIVKPINVNLNAAFVARTASSVVVDARDFGLFGWNIATGARIPQPTPADNG